LYPRGRNIFEISDEVWTRDEVFVANPSRPGPVPVDCAPGPSGLDGDGSGEESRRHEFLGASLFGEDPTGQNSARRSRVLGPVLVAGVLLLGASVVFHHTPEGRPAQARVEPTAPPLQLAPSAPAPGKTERPRGEWAVRARNSGRASSSDARPHQSRAGRVTPGLTSPRSVPKAAPTRPLKPAENHPLGHEFSFER
jgi:hypothetical protein